MKAFTQLTSRFPLVVYFVLAYAMAWVLYLLIVVSPMDGIPALFAPALAAAGYGRKPQPVSAPGYR